MRRKNGYADVAKVFGVPRYLISKAIRHIVGWVFSTSQRNRVYHKLKLYYSAGEIVEHIIIFLKKI